MDDNNILILFKVPISDFAILPPGALLDFTCNELIILLSLGKDRKGKARLVGTNYLNMPQCNNNFTAINFFEDYDRATSRTEKESLIYNMISSQMTLDDLRNAKQVNYQAEVVRTMPIALLVLDATKSYMAFSPAVVCGNHPSDMSLEFLGEVL